MEAQCAATKDTGRRSWEDWRAVRGKDDDGDWGDGEGAALCRTSSKTVALSGVPTDIRPPGLFGFRPDPAPANWGKGKALRRALVAGGAAMRCRSAVTSLYDGQPSAASRGPVEGQRR